MKVSWENGLDPETEDRLNFLQLNYAERWTYLMKLIMSNSPKKVPTNLKKRIEWT